MSFLYQLRNKIAMFLYGRNGMDQLNRALLIVGIFESGVAYFQN